jgi:hypothetical protein
MALALCLAVLGAGGAMLAALVLIHRAFRLPRQS